MKMIAGVAGTLALAGGILVSASALAGGAPPQKPECNWGQLTKGAIQGGFAQGDHSSDP
jgi:hypothetical protein